MYRYLLFCYYDYYPSGGMNDCIFKTNNFDELVPYINDNYNDDMYTNFQYYDVVEDKVMDAVMEVYENDYPFDRQRFVEWSENDD